MSKGPAAAAYRRTVCWAFCLTVAVTLLCFLPDLRNALLDWDDAGYIVENQHIKALSAETIRWAFGEFYLNYWAPLTWLSLAADYSLWGGNPAGYHLVNNLLHAVSAGFFFLISLELLGAASPLEGEGGQASRPAVGWALLAALFFAIHPLRVESVAWVTERKDVLGLFFALPALLAYLRFVRCASGERGRWGYYALSLSLFALSLCSKSLAVTLPVVLLILDWYPLRRLRSPGLRQLLVEKIPFFLLSGLCSLLTMKAQAQAITPLDQIDLPTRLLNACHSVAAYLALTVWPLRLSPFYVHPMHISVGDLRYLWPVALCCAITFCCFRLWRKVPALACCWAIFLVTLAPFLGFTQVGAQAMAGRFTYLAGLPLALLLAAGARAAASRLRAPWAVGGLGLFVALLLAGNALLTVREISFWKDDVTLWTRVIDLDPHASGRAYFQRCNAYRLRGKYQQALPDINEAIAIASAKKYRAMHELYQMRADTYLKLGDLGGALSDYSAALATAAPEQRPALLLARAEIYRRSGLKQLAAEDLRQAGLQP